MTADRDWEVYGQPGEARRAELYRGTAHLATVYSRWAPFLLIKMLWAQRAHR